MQNLPNKYKPLLLSLVVGLGLIGVYFMGFATGVASENGGKSFGQVFKGSLMRPRLGETDFSIFWSVLESVRKKYNGSIDYRDLVYGATKGLVEGLADPYSEFITPKENQEFQSALEGRYVGIGIEVEQIRGEFVIVAPVVGSPAAAAGLKAQDIIAAIDDKSVEGRDFGQVISAIRGPAGSEVKISVVRGNKLEEFHVKRMEVQVPSLELSYESDLAILRFRKFSNDTERLFKKAVAELLQKGVKGIVLDVRGNPGGYFDASVAVSNEFLPAGKLIVEQRLANGQKTTFTADGKGRLQDIPVIVLVDGGSASAAEILAGALKDNGRARLVGETTFGKGSIQEVEEYGDGSALKITIGNWYTPLGISISSGGLKPDSELEDNKDTKEDEQLLRAEALLR